MCVLCGRTLKYEGHEVVVEKSETPLGGPTQENLGSVGLDDVKFLAPKSVSYNGFLYERSWYETPLDFGKSLEVTYSFATQSALNDASTRSGGAFRSGYISGNGEAQNRKEFTGAQKASTREILKDIEKWTSIKFKEVTVDDAYFHFGAANLRSGILGVATLPTYRQVRKEGSEWGTVFLNNKEESIGLGETGSLVPVSASEYERGGKMYRTLIHEVGHALGLKHPHNSVEGDPSGTTFSEDDSRLSGSTAVLSYSALAVSVYVGKDEEGNSVVKPRYAKSFQTLDKLAIQHVYGKGSVLDGATEHDLEVLWEADKDKGGLQDVISDSGGEDIFEGHSTRGNRIDLREGQYSDVGYGHDLWLGEARGGRVGLIVSDSTKGATRTDLSRVYKGEYNVVVSLGSWLEHGKGGSEDDVIRGNGLSNRLEGMGGDDRLEGGGGSDDLRGGGGDDRLLGGGGADRLEGGEGKDVVDYSESLRGIEVEWGEGRGRERGDLGWDSLLNVEGVLGSDFADVIEGRGGGVVIGGGKGSDVIVGGSGNDVLAGSGVDVGKVWDFGVADEGQGTVSPESVKNAKWSVSKTKEFGEVQVNVERLVFDGEVSYVPYVESVLSWKAVPVERGSSVVLEGDVLALTTDLDRTEYLGRKSLFSDLWDKSSGLVEIFRYEEVKVSLTFGPSLEGRWVQEALLFDKNVTSDDRFGESLALKEVGGVEVLAVGAPGGGSVYVYAYRGSTVGWVLKDKVERPKAGLKDFGEKVGFESNGDLKVGDGAGDVWKYSFGSFGVKVGEDTSGDRVSGGDGDDRLYSGKGSDLLDGGKGEDVVVYRGSVGDYELSGYGDVITVMREGVEDRVYGVEKIEFYDKTLEVEVNQGVGVSKVEGDKFVAYGGVEDDLPELSGLSSLEVGSVHVSLSVEMSEGGYVYGIAVKRGIDKPLNSTIRVMGVEQRVEANEAVTLKIEGLESGSEYNVYLLAEDGYGNLTPYKLEENGGGSESLAMIDSSGGTLKTFLTTESVVGTEIKYGLEGEGVGKVSFALTGRGKVYYAYGDANLRTDAKALKGGEVVGAKGSGVMWVGEGEEVKSLYFSSLGVERFYLSAGDELYEYKGETDRTFDLVKSVEEESLLGVKMIAGGEDF